MNSLLKMLLIHAFLKLEHYNFECMLAKEAEMYVQNFRKYFQFAFMLRKTEGYFYRHQAMICLWDLEGVVKGLLFSNFLSKIESNRCSLLLLDSQAYFGNVSLKSIHFFQVKIVFILLC